MSKVQSELFCSCQIHFCSPWCTISIGINFANIYWTFASCLNLVGVLETEGSFGSLRFSVWVRRYGTWTRTLEKWSRQGKQVRSDALSTGYPWLICGKSLTFSGLKHSTTSAQDPALQLSGCVKLKELGSFSNNINLIVFEATISYARKVKRDKLV